MSLVYKAFISIRNGIFQILPIGILGRLADEFLRSRIRIHEMMRQKEARVEAKVLPALQSYEGEMLKKYILEKSAPWTRVSVYRDPIPGMITSAEAQYYSYITKFFTGHGEVVELGPWLGLSTSLIIKGLLSNPNFVRKKLFVFDDFVWRSSWMDKWVEGTGVNALDNHLSFEHLFHEHTKRWRDNIVVQRRKIGDYDGNQPVQKLAWSNGPIEMLFVDCGRLLEVNDAWYEICSPFFLKDKTLIIMQDWQNYKSVPEMHWENTKLFTDKKETALEMIHEVVGGGIGTFVYRG